MPLRLCLVGALLALSALAACADLSPEVGALNVSRCVDPDAAAAGAYGTYGNAPTTAPDCADGGASATSDSGY